MNEIPMTPDDVNGRRIYRSLQTISFTQSTRGTLKKLLTLSFFFLQVFVLRKKATHRIPRPGARFYIASLSPHVIVYKGQLTSDQVWTYFEDLAVRPFSLWMDRSFLD